MTGMIIIMVLRVCLIHTGPKCYIFFKHTYFGNKDSNAYPHMHTTHTHLSPGNRTGENAFFSSFKKKRVFKEDLKELTEVA